MAIINPSLVQNRSNATRRPKKPIAPAQMPSMQRPVQAPAPAQRPMQAPQMFVSTRRQTFTPARQSKPFQYAAPGSPLWGTDYGAQPEGYTEADYRNPYYTLPKSFTNANTFNPGGYSGIDEDNPFMQKQLADAVKKGTYTYQSYQPYAQKPQYQDYQPYAQKPQYQDYQQDRPQPDIYANNKKGGRVKVAQDTKKKYASGGKINLNECGVSTAPKGKKNSNW
jgi:hypothetical protein